MSASSNLVPIGAIRQPVHGRHHILSVLVENKAGVLARVALLFSRRGFNIYSLAVAPTDDERFSRITMVVDVETASLEQITKQLHKLINVLKITELDPSDAVEIESMLVTIVAEGGSRSRALELAELFRGQVLDVNAERLTLMFALAPSALDDVEALLGEFGIVEVQRSGRIALAKLPKPVRRVARRGKVS